MIQWKTKLEHKIVVQTFRSSDTISEVGTKSGDKIHFGKCHNLIRTSSRIPYEKAFESPKSKERLWLHDHHKGWKLPYLA